MDVVCRSNLHVWNLHKYVHQVFDSVARYTLWGTWSGSVVLITVTNRPIVRFISQAARELWSINTIWCSWHVGCTKESIGWCCSDVLITWLAASVGCGYFNSILDFILATLANEWFNFYGSASPSVAYSLEQVQFGTNRFIFVTHEWDSLLVLWILTGSLSNKGTNIHSCSKSPLGGIGFRGCNSKHQASV